MIKVIPDRFMHNGIQTPNIANKAIELDENTDITLMTWQDTEKGRQFTIELLAKPNRASSLILVRDAESEDAKDLLALLKTVNAKKSS